MWARVTFPSLKSDAVITIQPIETKFDMPRLPRLNAIGVAQHVIQRNNTRQDALALKVILLPMPIGLKSMLSNQLSNRLKQTHLSNTNLK